MPRKVSEVDTPSQLKEILIRQELRARCLVLTGDLAEDKNFEDSLLVVTDRNAFYSVRRRDIVEIEQLGKFSNRVWIRQGSEIWRSARVEHCGPLIDAMALETLSPQPNVRALAVDPDAGDAQDQALLRSGKTIEGAAKSYKKACDGGDSYPNDCAHYLSNAFILSGFDELKNSHSCIQARCGTSAKRPVRARDMWCWFKERASISGGAVTKNTGIWAVFQLKESEYWGGHVAIIDSDTWKYYGTGWYGSWDQYSFKW